jgi:ABC-2 type transport system ATP-binding protein
LHPSDRVAAGPARKTGGTTLNVEIDHLSKTYEGGVVGLYETTLTIEEGVFALLGPNGAGKSTLMTIIATLQDPTAGTVRVGGYDVRKQKHEVRNLLGYLPQDFGLYPALSVYETLDYMGILANMDDPVQRRKRIEEAMERVNLTAVSKRLIGQLSGGMRQRVGLAQAFLNSPKLLIVDEPTAGLDPEERIRVRSLLAELGGERVILLSTHVIEDVEAVADQVGVLHKGRVRFTGTITQMLDTIRGKVWQAELPTSELAAFRGQYLETGLLREGGTVRVRFIADDASQAGARRVDPTLEDAYIQLMREDSHVPA